MDATRLALGDDRFDIVFCTQVIEHVPDPAALVAETHRVLRPGGWLVLTGPFWWPHHEEPHDFHRFTRYGFANPWLSLAGQRRTSQLAISGWSETLSERLSPRPCQAPHSPATQRSHPVARDLAHDVRPGPARPTSRTAGDHPPL